MKEKKKLFSSEVELYVLPGGKAPERKTEGAIGFDAYIRAIVSDTEMDDKNSNLRKVLFDFENWPDDERTRKQVYKIGDDGGKDELIYRMRPLESVLVGIGFVTAMSFPLFYWIAPRSGLASRWGITVTNAPGTVGPDYRGEAGVLVYNRNNHSFDLQRDMRIAQVIFQWAVIPQINIVSEFKHLPATKRGSGGFGSTGLKN